MKAAHETATHCSFSHARNQAVVTSRGPALGHRHFHVSLRALPHPTCDCGFVCDGPHQALETQRLWEAGPAHGTAQWKPVAGREAEWKPKPQAAVQTLQSVTGAMKKLEPNLILGEKPHRIYYFKLNVKENI